MRLQRSPEDHSQEPGSHALLQTTDPIAVRGRQQRLWLPSPPHSLEPHFHILVQADIIPATATPPQLQEPILLEGTPTQALQGFGWLSAVPQSSGTRWISHPTPTVF